AGYRRGFAVAGVCDPGSGFLRNPPTLPPPPDNTNERARLATPGGPVFRSAIRDPRSLLRRAGAGGRRGGELGAERLVGVGQGAVDGPVGVLVAGGGRGEPQAALAHVLDQLGGVPAAGGVPAVGQELAGVGLRQDGDGVVQLPQEPLAVG